MIKHAQLWLSSVATAVLMASAGAQTWSERGDAGNLPRNAQVVSGYPNQELTAITGTIDSFLDVDMFQIIIGDSAIFRAWTTGDLSNSQLWLFDAAGDALWHNDDRPGDVVQPDQGDFHSYIGPGSGSWSYRLSTRWNGDQLGAGTATWGLPGPGIYLIAISAWNLDPRDSGGEFVVYSGRPSSEIYQSHPLDPDRRVASWAGTGYSAGAYTIHLRGAYFLPEPASMLALGVGLAGLLGLRWRKK